MIVVDTIDKMIAYRQWLNVHCRARECHNSSTVDLAALADRVGGEHPCLAKDLQRYFRCSKCGSRDVGFTSGAVMSNLYDGAYTGARLPIGGERPEPKRRRRARKKSPRL